MVDEKDAIGWAWQIIVALAGSVAAAWGTVVVMFKTRVDLIDQSVKAQAKSGQDNLDDLRQATHDDIRRLEDKVDRNHAVVVQHLMELKGG